MSEMYSDMDVDDTQAEKSNNNKSRIEESSELQGVMVEFEGQELASGSPKPSSSDLVMTVEYFPLAYLPYIVSLLNFKVWLMPTLYT